MAPRKPNLKSAMAEITSDLVDLRTRRLDILDRIDEVERAPLDRASIEARVDRALDSAAEEARQEINFGPLYVPDGGRFDISARTPPLAVLALLGQRETVKAALVAEAVREAGEAGGKPLDAVAREAELARLRDDLRDTE